MVIEEAVLIKADLIKIWDTFTDIASWSRWNTIATHAGSESRRMEKGKQFTFQLRPFSVPITIVTTIEEIDHQERISWRGKRFGIYSRHEFLFQQATNGVLLTSRETFGGIPVLIARRSLPEDMIRDLTRSMLLDLKNYSETDQ